MKLNNRSNNKQLVYSDRNKNSGYLQKGRLTKGEKMKLPSLTKIIYILSGERCILSQNSSNFIILKKMK